MIRLAIFILALTAAVAGAGAGMQWLRGNMGMAVFETVVAVFLAVCAAGVPPYRR